MNNIGFGIFCFGEEYYFKGTLDKINHILNEGYHCYILTDNPEYFTTRHSSSFLHVIQYDRNFKSYSDKMILPKYILKKHDISILLDADTHITDFSFLKDLKTYEFKYGISYIDTLLNHKSKKEFVKDLIQPTQIEWNSYCTYAEKVYPQFGEFETMWEYFLVINKDGFDINSFYYYYERLQVVKEYSDLYLKKEISGAGEGISIQISCKSANIEIQRDLELYSLLEGKMISISRAHTPRHLWPNWMK
jgi:thiol-disulfide isomerase/thioredoxin